MRFAPRVASFSDRTGTLAGAGQRAAAAADLDLDYCAIHDIRLTAQAKQRQARRSRSVGQTQQQPTMRRGRCKRLQSGTASPLPRRPGR